MSLCHQSPLVKTVSSLKVVHGDKTRPEDQQTAGGFANVSQSNKPAEEVYHLYVNSVELGPLSPTTTAESSSGVARGVRTTTTNHEDLQYSSLHLAEMENHQGYSELKQE